mgnify:CR=1 FL=1
MSKNQRELYPHLQLKVLPKYFQFGVSKLCDNYMTLLSEDINEVTEEVQKAYNFISPEFSENLLYCSCYEQLLNHSYEKGIQLFQLLNRDLVFQWEEFKYLFYLHCAVASENPYGTVTLEGYYEMVNHSRSREDLKPLTPEEFLEFMEFCLTKLRATTGIDAVRDLQFKYDVGEQEFFCSDPQTFRNLIQALTKVTEILLNAFDMGIFCFVEQTSTITNREKNVSETLGDVLLSLIGKYNHQLMKLMVDNSNEVEQHLHFLQKFAIIYNDIEVTDSNFWIERPDYNDGPIESDLFKIRNKYELNGRLIGQHRKVYGKIQSNYTISFYLASLNVKLDYSDIETLAKIKVEFSRDEFPIFNRIKLPLGVLKSSVDSIISANNSSVRINEQNILYRDDWYQYKDPNTGELVNENHTGEPLECNICHLDCLQLLRDKAPKSFYDWFDVIAEEVFKHSEVHTVVLHFDKFNEKKYKEFVSSCNYTELINKGFETESGNITLGDGNYVNNFASVVAILTITTAKKYIVQGLDELEPSLIEKKLLHIYAVDDLSTAFGNLVTADIKFHLRVVHNLSNELGVVEHYNALTNSNTLNIGIVKQNTQQNLDITGCKNQLYSKFVSVKDFEDNLEVGPIQIPYSILTSETNIPSFYTVCLASTLTPYEKFQLHDFTRDLTEMINESRKLSHPSFFYEEDIDKSKGKVSFKKSRFRIISVLDYLEDLVRSLEIGFFTARNIEGLANYDKVLLGQMVKEDYTLSKDEALEALRELTFFNSTIVKTFNFNKGEFTGTFSEAFDWVQSNTSLIFHSFDEYATYLRRNRRNLGDSEVKENLEKSVMCNLAPLNNEVSLEQVAYTLCIFLMQACVKDYNSFVFLQDILVLEDTEAPDTLGEDSGRKYRKPLYLGFLRSNEGYTADPFVTDELEIDKITPEMYDIIDLQIAQSEPTKVLCACPPVILDEFFDWYALSTRGDGIVNVDLTSFMCGYPHTEEIEDTIEWEDNTIEVIPHYDVYIKSRIYSQKILESICLCDKQSELYDNWDLRLSYNALGEFNPLTEYPECTHSIISSALVSNPYSLWAKASTFFDTGFTHYFYAVLAHHLMTTLGDSSFVKSLNWDKSSYECLNLDWDTVSIKHFSQVPVIHSMLEQYCLMHSDIDTHSNLKLPSLWREYFNRKIVSPSIFRTRKVLVPNLYVGSAHKYVENSRPRMTYFSLRENKLHKTVKACGDAVSNFQHITLLSFKQPISDLEIDFKSLSIDEVEKPEDAVESTDEFSMN